MDGSSLNLVADGPASRMLVQVRSRGRDLTGESLPAGCQGCFSSRWQRIVRRGRFIWRVVSMEAFGHRSTPKKIPSMETLTPLPTKIAEESKTESVVRCDGPRWCVSKFGVSGVPERVAVDDLAYEDGEVVAVFFGRFDDVVDDALVSSDRAASEGEGE